MGFAVMCFRQRIKAVVAYCKAAERRKTHMKQLVHSAIQISMECHVKLCNTVENPANLKEGPL